MKKLLLLLAIGILLPSICKAYIGVWRFQGDSADYSGSGNNGVNNSVTFSTNNGRRGQGVYFGGTQSIFFPYTASLDLGTGNGTWSLWINMDTTTGSSISVLDNAYNSYNNLFAIGFHSPSNPPLYSGVRDAAGTGSFPGFRAVSSSRWYHLALVRNGTTALTYLNGINIAASSTGSGDVWRLNAKLVMGAICGLAPNCPTPSGYIKAKMDEFTYDNTAWTAQRIKTQYAYDIGVF